MSFITAVPAALGVTAAELAGIGATISAANGVAAGPQLAVLPPAEEPASYLLIAGVQAHTAMHHASHAVAAVNHAMTVATMDTAGASYTATEVATAATLI
jgi:hypothetical protein